MLTGDGPANGDRRDGFDPRRPGETAIVPRSTFFLSRLSVRPAGFSFISPG